MPIQNRKRISVTIYGHQYTIIGDENSSHIRTVANMVDEKMRELNKCNPYLDTNKLAVLTAVNVVNDFLKLQNEYEIVKNNYEALRGKLNEKEEKVNNV